jgi:lipid II:glycine glycyltransferase (peptidoglycan interpeptide bridge formation enzyme)
LQLSGPEDRIFSGFKSNTRRNINKAVKEGVRVELGHALESVKAYYRLHCITRRDHGLPPQPFFFFKKIYDHVIGAGSGFTVLAFLKDVCIAGAVYLHFGKTAIYKFGASNKKYQYLRPNNLVMWEAIRESVKRGFQSFSFGKTEMDNEGLLQFKRSWNPKEEFAGYHKFDLKTGTFRGKSIGVKGFYNRIFDITPIPILRVMGAAMYRHLG